VLEEARDVLLDISTRTPIKVFNVRRDALVSTLDSAESSAVQFNLHLTSSQQAIVSLQDQCVCLLGRSGTGKTEVVVKRMVADYERGIRNLAFIAHSGALCRNALTMARRECGEEATRR